MLSRSCALVSHCKHVINLVNQLMSENVISFIDIHKCVSVSIGVSMSATESKDVKHVNKIDCNVFCDRVFF